MTGSVRSTIHDGLTLALRIPSTTRSRFVAFRWRCPVVFPISSRNSEASLSKSKVFTTSSIASAPIPTRKQETASYSNRRKYSSSVTVVRGLMLLTIPMSESTISLILSCSSAIFSSRSVSSWRSFRDDSSCAISRDSRLDPCSLASVRSFVNCSRRFSFSFLYCSSTSDSRFFPASARSFSTFCFFSSSTWITKYCAK